MTDADSLLLRAGQFMAIFPTLHEEEIIDLERIYDALHSYQQEINASDLMHDYDRLCGIVKDPNTKLPTLLALKENPLFTQIVEPIDKYNLVLTGLNNALPIGVYMLQRDDADHLPQELKDILQKHPSKKVKDAFYEKYYTNTPIPSEDQKEILNEKNILMNEIAEPLAEDYNDLREFGLTHWIQIKLSKTSERLLKSERLDINVAHKAFTYFKDNLITQRQFLNNSITIAEDNQLGIENIDRGEASIGRINAGFSLTRSWLFLKTLSERDENLPCKLEWKEFFQSPQWQEAIRQAQNNS